MYFEMKPTSCINFELGPLTRKLYLIHRCIEKYYQQEILRWNKQKFRACKKQTSSLEYYDPEGGQTAHPDQTKLDVLGATAGYQKYVCMHVCLCIFVCICIYVFVYVHAHMQGICMYMHIHSLLA